MFSAVSRAYFADPRRALSGKGTRKAPLGFGSEAVELIATPVVLAATAKAVECLADTVLKHTTGDGTIAGLRRLFRLGQRSRDVSAADDAAENTAPQADVVALRPEDIERLRHVVEATLHDIGTTPENARLIADAIIGRCQAPRAAD